MSVEVWMILDENGDYDVGCGEGEAWDRYIESVGEDGVSRRCIKLVLDVEKPARFTEVKGNIKITDGAGVVLLEVAKP